MSGSVPTRSAFAGPPTALGTKVPGPWRIPEPALAGPDKSGSARTSLMNLPSPSKFPSHWPPRLAATARKRSQVDSTPLMRFSAPSAHQAWRIHQRGFPHPLRSAFAVGSALTVCSPPCPAGLFRPAALMGFRSSHQPQPPLSQGPSLLRAETVLPARRPRPRARPSREPSLRPPRPKASRPSRDHQRRNVCDPRQVELLVTISA